LTNQRSSIEVLDWLSWNIINNILYGLVNTNCSKTSLFFLIIKYYFEKLIINV